MSIRTMFNFAPLFRTDYSKAFSDCVSADSDTALSAAQSHAASFDDPPPLHQSPPPPPHLSDLDVVFGRHLPHAYPPRVAVLLTGNLRNFLTPQKCGTRQNIRIAPASRDTCCRTKLFNSLVVDALGGPSVVHVFAVIGRSGGDSSADCTALRASVSAVRVCLELDPPVSDIDDVPPPSPSLLPKSAQSHPLLSQLHVYPASLSPLSAPPGYFARSSQGESGWRTYPGLPFGQPPG